MFKPDMQYSFELQVRLGTVVVAIVMVQADTLTEAVQIASKNISVEQVEKLIPTEAKRRELLDKLQQIQLPYYPLCVPTDTG
jgi:hypothetical protein